MGLTKLADDNNKGTQNLVHEAEILGGTGSAIAGTIGMKNALPRIDGMERYYHGTDAEGERGILREGIKGSKAGEGKVTQNANLSERIGDEALAEKSYVTKDRSTAEGIAKIQAGELTGNPLFPLRRDRQNERVIKGKIPYEDIQSGVLPTTKNPELRGMSQDEWVDAINKEVMFPPSDADLQASYDGLDAPRTLTVKGDTPTRYLKGADDYQGQSLAGLAKYVRNNPSRFAGGLGLAGLSAGAVGLGSYGVMDGSERRFGEEN